MLSYILITPARNEEAFIELTIKSVVKQTIRPLRWTIVSDGSIDGTDAIVGRYTKEHDWIELLRVPPHESRDFAGKVGAFNVGYSYLEGLRYDLIGSLDADLSFDEDYFAFLLSQFERDPNLGLAGTPFSEGGVAYDYRFSSRAHVSGACQIFRRECFEAIGGYVPLPGGGIDVIAVLSARVKGWRTCTFPEKQCVHHRPMNSANDSRKFIVYFKLGRRAFRLGYHPLWQVFRCTYQLTRTPYIMAGAALFCGYFWSMVVCEKRPVPMELILFQRRDQMRRLREFIFCRVLRLVKVESDGCCPHAARKKPQFPTRPTA
jgi:glycosyltransferase involved in cell wall biosynthesis